MKIYILTLLTFILSSCGNPHLSTKKTNNEGTAPRLIPQEEEKNPCIHDTSPYSSNTFYFNEEAFFKRIKCKKTIVETFNSFPARETYLLINGHRESFGYELIHKSEAKYLPQKVLYLEDIFSDTNYSMKVEKQIVINKIKGKDQGVDLTDVNKDVKESFLWSFQSPVSFWGAKVLDSEKNNKHTAKLRLFNCDHILIQELSFQYENQTEHFDFIGFVSKEKDICHVSLSTVNKAGTIGLDGFLYGQ